MIRTLISRAIYFASYVAAFMVAWQAVRFCQGHIGAPGVDQVYSLMQDAVGSPGVEATGPMRGVVSILGWMNKAFYYLGGIAVWVLLAHICRSAGWTAGRIVAVGYTRYATEVEEAHRRAVINDERDRRREALSRTAGAELPRHSVTTLAIGIVIGIVYGMLI